jgi:hypothetical protein
LIETFVDDFVRADDSKGTKKSIMEDEEGLAPPISRASALELVFDYMDKPPKKSEKVARMLFGTITSSRILFKLCVAGKANDPVCAARKAHG